jgi:CRISPR-associated protein Csy1
MSAARIAEEASATLARARAQLSRGDFASAGAALSGIAGVVAGEHALQAAELLIAARLPGEATDLAVRIAGTQPGAWTWLNHFAGHMRARGDLAASRRVVRAFIAAHPERSVERLHADAVLAFGLPSAYRDREELDRVRDEHLRAAREFMAAYPPDALADLGAAADDLARSNFHLAYQGCDDREAQSAYGDWLAASLRKVAAPAATRRAGRTRPAIACVSSKWHECTVGWYFAAWVEHLCRSWDVALVHTPGARRDALTARLAARCGREVALAPTLDAAAAQMRALGVDVVLYPELGADGFTFALAAQRLARLQACAWGHPVTSGLPTVDAFFSCAVMEPLGAAAHYRERLVALPGIGTKYAAPALPAESVPRPARLPADGSLYLMPQAIFKWHPDPDRHLVEIVRRDPRARFVLFELRPPSPARLVNERLLRALGEVSSHPAEHLIWMPECSRIDYLRINQACSVMVDTAHWSGGNATLDALLCGLPVVTLAGRFMRGRQSSGMLRLLGCEELIADSVDELAGIAVALAHDTVRREASSRKIRERLPSVIGSDDALIVLDESLRGMLAGR